MNRIAYTVILSLILISLVASGWLHHHAGRLAREKDLALRQQDEQVGVLQSEQRSFSNRLAEVRSSTNNPLNELAQLRQKVAVLQRKTNDLGLQIQSNLLAHVYRPARTEPPHTEEYMKKLRKLADGPGSDVLALGIADAVYLQEHQGRFPTSTDQLASYLQQEGETLTGTNQYDFIFKGTLDDLKGIPRAAVAVLR